MTLVRRDASTRPVAATIAAARATIATATSTFVDFIFGDNLHCLGCILDAREVKRSEDGAADLPMEFVGGVAMGAACFISDDLLDNFPANHL